MAKALDFILSAESVKKVSKGYDGPRATLQDKLNLEQPQRFGRRTV